MIARKRQCFVGATRTLSCCAGIPFSRRDFSAIASLSSRRPIELTYFVIPISAIAFWPAATMCAGVGKSGSPTPRVGEARIAFTRDATGFIDSRYSWRVVKVRQRAFLRFTQLSKRVGRRSDRARGLAQLGKTFYSTGQNRTESCH